MPRYGMRMTAVLTVLAVVAIATVATASWLASGAGAGYAEAGEAAPLGTAEATPSATLYPGVTGAVEISLTNPNPYPVKVTTVSAGTSAISSDTDGCAGTNVAFNEQTGLEIIVPAGSTGTAATLTGAVTMIGDAANACQGARFTIPVTFSGESAAS